MKTTDDFLVLFKKVEQLESKIRDLAAQVGYQANQIKRLEQKTFVGEYQAKMKKLGKQVMYLCPSCHLSYEKIVDPYVGPCLRGDSTTWPGLNCLNCNVECVPDAPYHEM